MITGHVFIATSLDGFIARADGGIDWLDGANAAGEDHGYDRFIAGMDGIVMGHATFRLAAGFDPWPYDLPVLVLSRTCEPDSLPHALAGKVSIVRSVSAALDIAAQRGWQRLYIDGGQTIRAFLDAGIVRDMILTRVPVLLGTGLPLFGDVAADIPLRHLGTRSFPSGLVQSHYQLTPG